MCGIVGAVAQRDIAEIFSKVYVVWNTVAMTQPVLPFVDGEETKRKS
mgnify:CR=1 FL=1